LRIILDAPDGMAIAVLDDPAAALGITQRCMSASAAGCPWRCPSTTARSGPLWMAVHSRGLIGDAVGTAAAIAHFAALSRLFVSRSFREALAASSPSRGIYLAAC
jgi:hypothetical protein